MADQDVAISFTGDATSILDAMRQIAGQGDKTGNILQIGLGVALGGLAVKGFEFVTDKAKDLVNFLPEAVGKFGDWAETVKTFTERLGTSAEAGSVFSVAMRHVGLDVESGSQQLNIFAKGLATLSDATATSKLSPLAQGLKDLGVNAFDSSGKLKDFNTIMPQIMDAFKALPAGVDATNIAMELFGTRGGPKFLDFLREGSAGLNDAKQKAQEFGLMLSDQAVNSAEEYSRSLNDLKMGTDAITVNLGGALLPVFKRVVDFINTSIVPAVLKYLVPAFKQLGEWLTGDGSKSFQAFFDQIAKFWQDIAPQLKEVLDQITGWLNEHKAEWQMYWDGLQVILWAAWGVIQSIVKVGLDILTGDFDKIGPDLQRIWGNIWDGMSNELRDKLFRAYLIAGDIMWKLRDFFNLLWVNITFGVQKFISDFWFGWTNGLNSITWAIQSFVLNAEIAFAQLIEKIREVLGIHSESSVLRDMGKNMRKGLESGWGQPELGLSVAGASSFGATSRGGAAMPGLGGMGGGIVINVPVTIQSVISTADRYQAESVLAPIIGQALRKDPTILRLLSKSGL